MRAEICHGRLLTSCICMSMWRLVGATESHPVCRLPACLLGSKPCFPRLQAAMWELDSEDSCTELYRRAYCGSADVFYVPAFLAAAAALCYVPLAQKWLLLLVLPVAFWLGVYFVVIKGALVRSPGGLGIAGWHHQLDRCACSRPELLRLRWASAPAAPRRRLALLFSGSVH
jgi:hypothetical protein